MTRSYRLSSIAEDDVASIARYIAADNLDAALRMIDRFTMIFSELAAEPDLGERYEGRGQLLRRYSVGNYLVFYQTFANEIVVARVLHGARQWEHLI